MKRIAVLTWFNRGRNYGQTLQAFALNETIRGLGCRCELLSYGRNGPRLQEDEINELSGEKRDLQIKFARFIRAHMDYSPRLKSREEVERYLQEQGFDAVVCGSDQIWNLALTSFEPVYMLDFPLACPKISYAAGMMDRTLYTALERHPEVPALLEDFAAVSVRENAAREMVREVTRGKVDPEVVLDPTLLLTKAHWLQAVEVPPGEGERYLFCYMFQINREQKRMIAELSRRFGCGTVVFLDPLKEEQPDIPGVSVRCVRNPSVEQFLSLIAHAEAVVTDSFHGVAFSLIFEREFFALECAVCAPERNTDRIATLLETAGLTQRLIRTGEEDGALAAAPVDYARTGQRLAAQREQSLAWLRRAIEE